MVSQFVSSHEVGLLGDLDFDFPEGTHAIGRLDADSEGLLLCTTDKSITRRLFQGAVPHERTYLVMVKWLVLPEKLEQWSSGVVISAKGGSSYLTRPCKASLFDRMDAVKFHPDLFQLPQYGSFTWISLTLTEGKYHQVRKMVDVLGHKCIRLIRTHIEDLHLGKMSPGEVCEIEAVAFMEKLKLTGE
jgi:23S rRNA pseudouridine2457 synthase